MTKWNFFYNEKFQFIEILLKKDRVELVGEKNMRKYNLLLFDLDGTLMDYSVDQKFAVKYAFEKMGYEYTEDILEQYKKIDDMVWKKLEKGEIKTIAELYQERCKILFEIYDINEAIDKFNHLLDEGFYENGTLFKGVENVLKRLSEEYKLAIVTNGPKKQQHIRLENAKVLQYFSYVFTSEEVGYNKPNIKFFDYVFEKLEEKDKSKMLIIGDSLTSDIQGGRNAGLDTCWYNMNCKKNNTIIKSNYEINKIEKILNILER